MTKLLLYAYKERIRTLLQMIANHKAELRNLRKLTTDGTYQTFITMQREIDHLKELHSLAMYDNERLMKELATLQHITKHLTTQKDTV